jgi:hypothetical protein
MFLCVKIDTADRRYFSRQSLADAFDAAEAQGCPQPQERTILDELTDGAH